MSFFSKFSRLAKSRSILGIDIGTSYIKTVQVSKEGDESILERYGLVNVVYPAGSSAKIDFIKQTAEIMRALYKQAGFSAKEAIVSIPSSVAFVSVLNLPPMTDEKELQKSVEYQAKRFIPLPLTDVNLGWQILDESQLPVPQTPIQLNKPEDQNRNIKVLLTAVPRNVVYNYTQVFEQAGLQLRALEIESLSLIRSLVLPDDLSSILIVDVGARSTILSLVHNRNLWSTHHLTVGADTITESIAKSMGLSFERAEQLRNAILESEPDSAAVQIARNIYEMIKTEIQQFQRLAENHGKKVSKIILTGGGSKLPGFAGELAVGSPPIEYGHPIKQISFPQALEAKLKMLEPQLAVCVGLAIRSSAP